MKTGWCPRCQGTEVYEIDEMRTPDWSSANYDDRVTLIAHYGDYGARGMMGAKKTRIFTPIRAYVCAGCAYSELYAKDLEALARLAQDGTGGVRKVKR